MPDTWLYAIIGALAGGGLVALVLVARLMRVSADRAALAAELDASHRATAEQRALVAHSQTQLREAFAALSHDALRQNRQDFLHSADSLLKPVRDTLDRVRGQLADVDKAREGSFRAVASQLTSLEGTQKELRDAALGLTRALRSPHARGRWGELQLRRILELAGLTHHADFVEKPIATTESGSRQTPDLLVHLPGQASIVIDAKVPIDGYLAAAEAETDPDRRAHMAAHMRQVREHIRTLGSKEYWKQFPSSPEFVVMFLPLEPLLAAALEEDGDLLEQAAGLRVIPATPLTLLALLKAVALGWRQEKIERNAEEIQQIGRDLYDRLATMVEHLEGVGRNIKQAADSYDRFVGSLEQKVLPGARRFKELGVNTSRDIEPTEPLHLSPRPVTRPELTGEDENSDREADAPRATTARRWPPSA